MVPRWRRFLWILPFAVFSLVDAGQASAQALTPDQPANRTLILAEEQFHQGLYHAAEQTAHRFLAEKGSNVSQLDADHAKFIVAVADLKTESKTGIDDAEKLLSETGDNAYRQRLSFSIAQYYFKKEQYKEAKEYYEKAGLENLSNAEIAAAKFELAYCYFVTKNFKKAEPLFSFIKELKEDKYYMAANYYYGLLCYNENKLEQALRSFERIKAHPDYHAVVPYYIAEINYFQGKKETALKLGIVILSDTIKSYYDNDVHLLIAQCYFEDLKFKEAVPFFEYYYNHTDKIRKEDLYKMGYCYYQLHEWKKAVEDFKTLSNEKDSLGQTAMYLLGDCYLKTNDRVGARNAFGFCADMPFNKAQQEASMILFARLSYEDGFYDAAIEQLKTLLKTFPSSSYGDEANTMTSDLLLKTADFEKALEYLKAVNTKDKNYWQVYQKASYGYGVQQFRKGNSDEALANFQNCIKHEFYSPDYEAAALFWMGELHYREKGYLSAITEMQGFLNRKLDTKVLAGFSPVVNEQHANLTIGYCYFEMKKYADAQVFFNKAAQYKNGDAATTADAAIHEADAIFMTQNFEKALSLYDKVVKNDSSNADYAQYQKSIILGLQGKTNDKIWVLNEIVKKVPQSVYANSARYELAITYIETNKYPQALNHLKYLVDSANDKALAPKAWLKIGFVHQANEEPEEAIRAYKVVVSKYPASDERMTALDALKSLYIQTNQPGSFAQFLKETNLPGAERNALDSTYYAAAENQYASSKWDEAIKSFNAYLKEFPNGLFAIKAHYYRAECNYQLKANKTARKDYDTVLAHQWNEFSENSAARNAIIAYSDSDYNGAFGYYKKLKDSAAATNIQKQLCYQGMMKSAYRGGKDSLARINADSFLALRDNTPENIVEAKFIKARAEQKSGKTDSAMEHYKLLIGEKNGDVAAESRYRISEILASQDSLMQAEQAANETIKEAAGHEYWIVKSYILLGDIFIKEKDYFNAKATFASIVKHCNIAELKQEASTKLEVAKDLEKKQSKLKKEESKQ